jgi:aspartyl-tRNA(Asn)/glutamyl-tRNA(Gln) amidotransferase subunit A
MSGDVLSLSAADIIALYKSQEISPVEVITAALDRIDHLNPVYNAFVMIDREGALAGARASEERWRRGETNGLVDGLPVTVKDLVTVRGMPTRRGSRTTNLAPSEEDGPPVARMRQHGAVFLGKTTTSEFGWKAVTDSPLSGVTRNLGRAINPRRKQRRRGCRGRIRIGSTPSWHGWWRFHSNSRRLLRRVWF